MPVSTRLARQGCAGSSAMSSSPRRAAIAAHRRLVDPGLDEGVSHAVLARGDQAWPVIAEIVQVGPGGDRRVGQAADAGIEVGLAVETAVDRVATVARIVVFTGVDDAQLPVGVERVPAHPRRRRCRNGRRYRVQDFDTSRCREPRRDARQRQAVDAAAHRDRDPRHRAQRALEAQQRVTHRRRRLGSIRRGADAASAPIALRRWCPGRAARSSDSTFAVMLPSGR